MIRSLTWAWRFAKISGEVEINADSWRLPRVKFCEVMTETVSPASDFTNKILLWLSARSVRSITWVMNAQSLSVLFVALWSRTRFMRLTFLSFVIKSIVR